MVIILYGNSDIGAHGWSDLGKIFFIDISHNSDFYLKKTSYAQCSELLSNISSMVYTMCPRSSYPFYIVTYYINGCIVP